MHLRFRCPKTEAYVETRIESGFESVQRNWSKDVSLRCPHCGGQHAFGFKDGYLEAVLAAPQQPSFDLPTSGSMKNSAAIALGRNWRSGGNETPPRD